MYSLPDSTCIILLTQNTINDNIINKKLDYRLIGRSTNSLFLLADSITVHFIGWICPFMCRFDVAFAVCTSYISNQQFAIVFHKVYYYSLLQYYVLYVLRTASMGPLQLVKDKGISAFFKIRCIRFLKNNLKESLPFFPARFHNLFRHQIDHFWKLIREWWIISEIRSRFEQWLASLRVSLPPFPLLVCPLRTVCLSSADFPKEHPSIKVQKNALSCLFRNNYENSAVSPPQRTSRR